MNCLKTLPPVIIRKIADDLRTAASELDAAAKAADHEHTRTVSSIRRVRGIELATRLANELARDGMSLDDAARAAVQRYHNSFPELSIEHIRFNAETANERQRRKARELKRLILQRRIMMFWRDGLTDEEIGPRVGRHPKTVAKIRRRAMKDMKALKSLDESVQRASNRGMKHEVGLWAVNCR